ncbi:hypothetical protein HHK36_005679 [Tetracentron sinense]|uniref:Acid phosphatase/vanadium-dependent haloperoxidase-related protein n=1 Tax=Tetracentron sinense TaxID=13715 RepID=A0A834ZLV4_TETSI|nr:hypothetical protein HHK36_005679 [Tetracentron sinense]
MSRCGRKGLGRQSRDTDTPPNRSDQIRSEHGRGDHHRRRFLHLPVNGASSFASPIEPPSLICFPLLCSRSVSQALHHLVCRFKEKRWDSRRMLGSGGMPSSHSSTVTALAVAIGLQEGTGGSAFALAVVLACVVMYDASGVRLHAGRQAELLNQIVCELPPEHPLTNIRPLRDSLGHTPLQVVAGAALGFIVAYLMRNSS